VPGLAGLCCGKARQKPCAFEGGDNRLNVTRAQLEGLCDIAREAGKAILALYEQQINVAFKADNSPLTEADTRSDAIIRARLEAAFPEIFILSEESVSGKQAPADAPFFLVDPLDGTQEFLKRNGEFTVNIALVAQGLRAGVIYAPVLNQMYAAAAGLGAFRQGNGEPWAQIRVAKAAEPLRVIGSRSHESADFEAWRTTLAQRHDVLRMGSSLKFCRMAEGSADFYPRFGPTCQWDTAAGQCILEVAGGQVLDAEGQPFCYARSRPILNPFFVAFGDPALRPLARAALNHPR